MECAEIRSNFVAGRVPAGPDVEAHCKQCLQCRELFENDARLGRCLAQAVQPEIQAGELFALVERDVQAEVGLRARLRALPTSTRTLVLVGVVGALMLGQFLLPRLSDFGDPSPSVFWGVALALGATLLLGVRSLTLGGLTPLSSPWWQRGVALALLAVPALAALLAPIGAGSMEAAAAWGNPAGCFSYGAASVVPVVLLYWLFERREVVPVSALVSAGALAGLAANLVLHVHCGSAHAGHLLFGHASVGLAWAFALRLVWGSPQSFR